jgi:multicomponent K+:H+ antiporter subunit D
LPPLSGFVAKFGLFHALLHPDASNIMITSTTWALMALIVLSGLAAIISLMRFGVRTFWASGAITSPSLHLTEVLPISALLLLCVVLTVQAGPVFAYLERTSEDLHRPAHYIERVIAEPAVPSYNAGSRP